jgi:hypothetical protein
LDAGEFLDDDFNSLNDSFGFVLELDEFFSVFSSLFSEGGFLFVQDV